MPNATALADARGTYFIKERNVRVKRDRGDKSAGRGKHRLKPSQSQNQLNLCLVLFCFNLILKAQQF